jgi:hypothetical protein
MLVAHIVIALTSIVFTAYLYFSPSRTKLRASYALVALTIGSGTWLIIANPAHMVQACLTGLVYLGAVFFGISMARDKLAETNKTN